MYYVKINFNKRKPKFNTRKSCSKSWHINKNHPEIEAGATPKGHTLLVISKAIDNTIWNVVSLTKPVTTLITLNLSEAGKLDLDKALDNYYIDLDLITDPRAKQLTPRLILSHRTGFENWRVNSEDGKLKFYFDPGTSYQYSGEGYEYLRKVLESKFNKSIETLAEELIFRPLNMQNTFFTRDDQEISKRFAKWHDNEGNQYLTEKNTKANAADNLLTTVEDYNKFILHMLEGAGLSKELQDAVIYPESVISENKHFGLGWWFDKHIDIEGGMAMVHGGDDIGVHTLAIIIPKTKQALVIFTNSDLGTSLYEEVIINFLGKIGQAIIQVETNNY